VGFAVKNYDETVVKPALAKITDEKERRPRPVRLTSFLERMKNAEPLAAALKDCLAKHKLAPASAATAVDRRRPAGARGDRVSVRRQLCDDRPGRRRARSAGGGPGDAGTGRRRAERVRRLNAHPHRSPRPGGLSAKVDFAGGDMKAYARTARPIGGVLVRPRSSAAT